MSTRGDLIGDAVADALNSPPLDVTSGTIEERKHRIWRAICNALELYFDPRWIDIYVDPTVTPVYVTGTTPYPMQTIAWQLTLGSDVPVALWIKSGSGVLSWSRLWPASGGASFPGFYRGAMRPVGVDDPGNSGLAADGLHSHPPQTAEVYGATLTPKYLLDPRDRGPVRFVYTGSFGCVGLLFDGWAEIAPGRYQAPLYNRTSFSSAHCDGATPADGDRFIAYNYNANTESQTRQLIYRVVDCGVHTINGQPVSTKPVVERVPELSVASQYVQGLTTKVTEGILYAGMYLRLNSYPVVFGSPVYWLVNSSFSDSTEHWELLTADQEANAAGIYKEVFQFPASVSVQSGQQPFAYPNACITKIGTPGVSAIPAGPFRFYIRAKLSSDWAGANTTVTLRLRVVHGDNTVEPPFVEAISPPIHGTDWADYECVGALAAAVVVTPSDRIEWLAFAQTTGTSGEMVWLQYNHVDGFVRVITTITTLSVPATTDHQKLSNRWTNVAQGQEQAHPWGALGPDGRIHTKIGVGTVADGLLDLPADCNSCEVDIPTTDLLGINADGFLPGDLVRVTVTNASTSTPKTLRHGQMPAAPYKGLVLAKDSMSSYQPIVLKNSPARMAFQLSRAGDSWHLVERPIA